VILTIKGVVAQIAIGLAVVVSLTATGLHTTGLHTADAQTSYPMIMSLHPTATQIGQTTEHTISSRHSMYRASDVWVSGAGIKGEIVPSEVKVEEGKDPPNLQEIKIKFHVEADALPGVREFRIATPRGVSTIGQLVVGRTPVVSETQDNDTIEQAQAVEVPATLCGNIEKAEDVDFYSFAVQEGKSLTFHVQSMRLQNKIHDLQQHSDPIITLRNAAGSTLATSDNYFFGDPFVSYKFVRGGKYSLEIRDVRYQGNQYWEYSIEVSDTPYVTNVYPMGLAPQHETEVELIGHNLTETKTKLTLPDTIPLGLQNVSVNVGSSTTNPAPVIVTDLPLTLESADDNNTPQLAQAIEVAIEVAVGVNGRLEKQADIDCYSFVAKKGESFSFEVIARRHGSSMDSHMRILDEKGKELKLNDDLKLGKRTYSDSWIENWIAPADGTFVIELRDLHLRSGASFTYFLKVERSRPYFELFVDTDKTLLAPAMSGVIFVRVERKNGFAGEIQLELDGLPDGVSSTCGKILAGAGKDGCIVLTADASAPTAMTNITIRGKSTYVAEGSEPIELSMVAQPYQETYQPGGGRGHFPVSAHTVSVGEPNDIRSIELSTYDLTLKPGQSKQIDVTLQRAEGFDKNVTLDVIYKHLSSVYGDSLPAGVTLDGGNSKTLLSKGATQGHITLKAADDAPPATQQQVAVMAGVSLNFVMKATYASKPLLVSVEAKGEK
jgi:hypothetical protein